MERNITEFLTKANDFAFSSDVVTVSVLAV